MIELVKVTKQYGSPTGGDKVTVLQDLDLKVEQGQCVAVVGPSGCGKSTLLNIIGALDKPTSGRVMFDGSDLAGLSDRELAKLRNTKLGFVFQLHHLLPQCTVLENVLLPTIASHSAAAANEKTGRAKELLDRVGLHDFAFHRPAELSGGQRQRVAVVRALINQPSLLLADEPTGSLDKDSSDNIADLLVELNRTDKLTMIVVTHSTELAAKMGTLYKLENGKISEAPRT
jgi:ABC-type lipoprotein export system ATPase subunit